MGISLSLASGVMEKIVIVGGGVAGLACLNAFIDKELSPLLIESSLIGSPKMCGEFLAPLAVEQLNAWDIGPLQTIKYGQFLSDDRARVQLSFSRPAGAYQRHLVEIELAMRARANGARIIEQSPIKTLIPATASSPFVLHFASGEPIEAQDIIFATGQFSTSKLASDFVGFKTHLPHMIKPETLLMYSLLGGYLGIVPVGSNLSNLTCLIKRSMIEKAGSCKTFLSQFLASNGLPEDIIESDWLEGAAPSFGLKKRPNWPHAYWIGDAFASIHPAVGYGFAHSIHSALLAVNYYLNNDAPGFHQTLQHLIRPKRMMGQCMHYLLQKPRLCRFASAWIEANTSITHRLLTILDY